MLIPRTTIATIVYDGWVLVPVNVVDKGGSRILFNIADLVCPKFFILPRDIASYGMLGRMYNTLITYPWLIKCNQDLLKTKGKHAWVKENYPELVNLASLYSPRSTAYNFKEYVLTGTGEVIRRFIDIDLSTRENPVTKISDVILGHVKNLRMVITDGSKGSEEQECLDAMVMRADNKEQLLEALVIHGFGKFSRWVKAKDIYAASKEDREKMKSAHYDRALQPLRDTLPRIIGTTPSDLKDCVDEIYYSNKHLLDHGALS